MPNVESAITGERAPRRYWQRRKTSEKHRRSFMLSRAGCWLALARATRQPGHRVTVAPPTRAEARAARVTRVTHSNGTVRGAHVRRGTPRTSEPARFFGTWIRSFLVVFVLCAAWTVTIPLGGAPDEPAHIVKAAATVRGELIGQPVRHAQSATRDFRVPALFKSVYQLPACYQFHSDTPAGCAPTLRSSGRIVTVSSYVGRYPPFYYAVVGLPTLVMHSETVIYFMRLLSALMAALLLSLALTIAVIWCRATMMFEAIALAMTPLAIFFAGVVNPNGFEIAAAICAWTSGLALVRNGPLQPPRPVVFAFFASGCLLELTRGLSVLWMALILLTLVCLEPRSCLLSLRRWSVRIGVAVLVVVGAVGVVYVVTARTLHVLPSSELPPAHESFVVLTEHVLGQLGFFLRQFLGVFGWLDTPSPLLSTILWASLLGFIVVLGLMVSKKSDGVVLALLLLGSFVLTMALIEWNYPTLGITWQARDGFPLYAGVPLVAGIVIPRSSLAGFGASASRRIALVVALGVGLTQLGDLLWTLRRFTVGLGHTVNPFHHVSHGWSPPLGTLFAVVLASAAAILYASWLFKRMAERNDRVVPAITGS
jgi:hypothetical protein